MTNLEVLKAVLTLIHKRELEAAQELLENHLKKYPHRTEASRYSHHHQRIRRNLKP